MSTIVTSLRNRRAVLSVMGAVMISQFGFGQDWPEWRGPYRNGLVAYPAPRSWPERLTLRWKVPVGEGHSSPIVAGDRVYTFTRQNEREVASCLELATGRTIWQDGYHAPYQMNSAAVSHGKGPKSTPLFYAGRLYTLGITGTLSCFEAATGRLRWRKEFSASPLYGTAMSPVVENGLLIAHVGGHDRGSLTAFNATTGEVRWSWNGDGPGYSSPIVATIDGTRQVVTQTQQHVVGVSAATGQLLWQIPYSTEYVQNIVTPVYHQGLVIFSGLDKGTTAIRVVKRGAQWATEQVWHNPDVSMYLNSPVANGNLLFGLSHKRKGQFFCLDATTGRTLWTSNGREGENAAILRVGDVLLLLTNDAQLIVASAVGDGFRPLKRYTVASSPTWAHPVFLGNRILVKDASTLSLLSL